MGKDAAEPGNSPVTMGVDCVGASVRIKGEISGNADLLVEGTVEGPIRLAGHKLTVGPSAKLNSEVAAREIIVQGSVKGNLRASERIEIMKNGSVVGDIITARILIEDGASFRGSIEIDRKEPATASAEPVLARAAVAPSQPQSGKTNAGR